MCFLFLHVELNLHKILKALFHPAPPPLLFVSVGCVLVFGWWDGVGVVFGVGWVSPHLWTAFPLSLLAPSLLPPYPPSNPQITTLRRGSHSGGQFSLTIFLYKAKAPPKKITNLKGRGIRKLISNLGRGNSYDWSMKNISTHPHQIFAPPPS